MNLEGTDAFGIKEGRLMRIGIGEFEQMWRFDQRLAKAEAASWQLLLASPSA
jgi:hypothetical protein